MPRGRGSLGVIFPIDDALHNIAFEIHAKELNRSTCCLICWLWVGPRYHVLDGGPDPPRGRGNFFWGGNVTVPCKIMGHLTLSCATTAEPIDMSFWMKTRVGTCYIWCRSSTGRGQFSVVVVTPDLSGPFKSIGNVRCSWRHICGKRDHSVANNIMQQNGLFINHYARKAQIEIPKILSSGDAAYQLGTGWWKCTTRAKSDIYDCLVVVITICLLLLKFLQSVEYSVVCKSIGSV